MGTVSDDFCGVGILFKEQAKPTEQAIRSAAPYLAHSAPNSRSSSAKKFGPPFRTSSAV